MRYLFVFFALNLVSAYAASNRLDLENITGIQEIKMNAAFSTTDENIAFENVRIRSDQTDLDDYVQLFYEMNPQTLNLEFKNSVVYKDIGVIYYKEAIFMTTRQKVRRRIEGAKPCYPVGERRSYLPNGESQ